MQFKLWFLVALLVGSVQSATAQHAALSNSEIGPSGKAYANATRLRAIDERVVYFDPSQPAPPLETRQTPGRETREQQGRPDFEFSFGGGQIISLVITSLVLLGIAYLFVVYGGRFPVSFSRDPSDAGQGKQSHARPSNSGNAGPIGIEAALRLKDRRNALVALCRSLLARVVSAEGILLQDSWTDRDTLRHVPRSFAQRDDLRALVFASERVQFGGRDVTEDEFSDHVRRLRPIWTEAPK